MRLLAALLVLPGCVAAVVSRRPALLATGAAAVVALAETGRRRAGGTAVFPAATAWTAPLSLLERGVCSWFAVSQALCRGGVRHAGGRLGRAANSTRALRRRLAQPRPTARWRQADSAGADCRYRAHPATSSPSPRPAEVLHLLAGPLYYRLAPPAPPSTGP